MARKVTFSAIVVGFNVSVFMDGVCWNSGMGVRLMKYLCTKSYLNTVAVKPLGASIPTECYSNYLELNSRSKQDISRYVLDYITV